MDTLREALQAYNWKEVPATAERYGHGHINVTYVIPAPDGARYILQRVNKNVFKQPVELMENVAAVTNYLSARTEDPRGCLRLIPTKNGENFFTDSEGDYWRVYLFITDSICLQQAETGEDFRQSAIAFGEFQKNLKDFPAETLHEVIPHFHDTKDRYRLFKEAVAADLAGRAKDVAEEIAFYMDREDFAGLIVDKLEDGRLPLRVTHNDTKLNNVMLDKSTRKALCVIDLDTVMPGLIGHDFGDAIRFAANFVEEDCAEPEKAGVDLDVFRAFAEGFLSQTAGTLTETEVETLALSCFVLTAELATRFLADYLDGDLYFNTKYPGHNLVRARCQIALAKDMMGKLPEMETIVRDCVRKFK